MRPKLAQLSLPTRRTTPTQTPISVSVLFQPFHEKEKELAAKKTRLQSIIIQERVPTIQKAEIALGHR